MASNTQFIYTPRALLKVIEDGDSVRIKICPVCAGSTNGPVEYDEGPGATIEVSLDRRAANLVVKAVRYARNRTWGKDE